MRRSPASSGFRGVSVIWGYVVVASLTFLAGAILGYFTACKDHEDTLD